MRAKVKFTSSSSVSTLENTIQVTRLKVYLAADVREPGWSPRQRGHSHKEQPIKAGVSQRSSSETSRIDRTVNLSHRSPLWNADVEPVPSFQLRSKVAGLIPVTSFPNHFAPTVII